ncbi:hypothetical protein ACFE04_021537 [Oxalis oulophora]
MHNMYMYITAHKYSCYKNWQGCVVSVGELRKGKHTLTSGPPEGETKEFETSHRDKATSQFTYTTLNWLDYLDVLFENLQDDVRELFENDEIIVIKHVKQLAAVLKILSKVDKKVLGIFTRQIDTADMAYFETGNSPMSKAGSEFKEKKMDSEIDPFHREKRCLEVVKNQFPHLFAHMLIQDQENASEIRSEVTEMISNIQLSFEETITESEWLDSGTKMAALNKLKHVTQLISYQDWMTDADGVEMIYTKKVIIPGLFYSSLRSMKITQLKKRLALLGSENNDEPVSTDPIQANASYSADLNLIDIPIAIMGPPLYGLGLHALNYGTIGYIFAHELSHGFDNFGKEFNSWGKQKPWWKKSTKKIYEEKTKCFINSYNALYIPEAKQMVTHHGENERVFLGEDLQLKPYEWILGDFCGVILVMVLNISEQKNFLQNILHFQVNGIRTLDENIADTMGFRESLRAYRRYVAKHGPEKLLPNFEYYSHEKLFTMAFAALNCQIYRPSVLRHMMDKNEHSPGRARVLGVLKNSDEFAKIWACEKGKPMNPNEKCVLL